MEAKASSLNSYHATLDLVKSLSCLNVYISLCFSSNSINTLALPVFISHESHENMFINMTPCMVGNEFEFDIGN